MAGRIAIVLTFFGVFFGSLWLLLPIVRAAMLPSAEPGTDLLWVIGPPYALRFGACTVITALTMPFALRPLGKRWREQDAARGVSPASVTSGRHLPVLVRGGLLFVIYAVCGAFYFVSYGEVRESSITFHSPLGARTYRYDQITRLQHQPPVGGQVDRYALELDDGRWGYFDASCEGVDAPTVLDIAAHVSEHAHRPWTPGAR